MDCFKVNPGNKQPMPATGICFDNTCDFYSVLMHLSYPQHGVVILSV